MLPTSELKGMYNAINYVIYIQFFPINDVV